MVHSDVQYGVIGRPDTFAYRLGLVGNGGLVCFLLCFQGVLASKHMHCSVNECSASFTCDGGIRRPGGQDSLLWLSESLPSQPRCATASKPPERNVDDGY